MPSNSSKPPNRSSFETVAAREKARAKKHRRQQPRSKRRYAGSAYPVLNKIKCGTPTLIAVSNQTIAVLALVPPGLIGSEPPIERPPEALPPHVTQIILTIDVPDRSAVEASPFLIEHDKIARVDTYAAPPESIKTSASDDCAGLLADVSASSMLTVVGQLPLSERPRLGMRGRLGLVAAGSAALFGAIWLLSPVPSPGVRAAVTTGQAAIPDRPWTDVSRRERVHTTAEASAITSLPEQSAIITPTDTVVVEQAPSVRVPVVRQHANVRPIESTIGLVPAIQEVVNSVPIAMMPLPPRRPASLLARRTPEPSSITFRTTGADPDPVEKTPAEPIPVEAYASFSARKHEIGSHKLAWGVARLHEDANSDSGRGPTWDFVPSR